MVLSFFVALFQPTLAQLHYSTAGEIPLNESLAMCLASVLMAILVWRAPGFAADLLAGSPSLSTGTVSQHVAGAAQTIKNSVQNAAKSLAGAKSGGAAAAAMGGAAAARLASAATRGGGKDADGSGAARPSGGGATSPGPNKARAYRRLVRGPHPGTRRACRLRSCVQAVAPRAPPNRAHRLETGGERAGLAEDDQGVATEGEPRRARRRSG